MQKGLGIILLGGATWLLPLASPAVAEYSEAKRPRIPITRGFPEITAARVHQVFDRKEHKFAGGHYLTFWTSLRFSGDTKAASAFLEELAKCPGVVVNVSFSRFEGGDADWRVGQIVGSRRFQVEFNLDSRRVKIEDVVLPELKGPPVEN